MESLGHCVSSLRPTCWGVVTSASCWGGHRVGTVACAIGESENSCRGRRHIWILSLGQRLWKIPLPSFDWFCLFLSQAPGLRGRRWAWGRLGPTHTPPYRVARVQVCCLSGSFLVSLEEPGLELSSLLLHRQGLLTTLPCHPRGTLLAGFPGTVGLCQQQRGEVGNRGLAPTSAPLAGSAPSMS